ncbi:MAG: hypothetical protein NT039_03810 [Candidatus Berkelbacteria bacterium]|nr:hypothetical protein [Candidatus Berkelbacteria bacterium]
MNQRIDEQPNTQTLDSETSPSNMRSLSGYERQDNLSSRQDNQDNDELERHVEENFISESDESGTERDFEEQAVYYLNGLVENQENRADFRYGEGRINRMSAWFDREGKRVEEAQDLDTAGEYKESGELRKWAKIGLKVAGGFGLAAAMTFTGIGVLPIVTPILWTIGMRNGFDGVLEAAERLGWGAERTERELKAQKALSEEIAKLKGWIKKRKAEGRGLTEDEYFILVGSISNASEQLEEVEKSNLESERNWALGRAVASSVLTIGTAVFAGIPLGIKNYDHFNSAHHVFWNQHGAQFVYNDPSKLAHTAQLAQAHQMDFSYYHDIFGRAAHTLGRGLSLADWSAVTASGLYLLSKYCIAKEKKGEKVSIFRTPYKWSRESTPIIYNRRRTIGAGRVPAVVSKEMTLGDKKELSRKFAMITLARIRSYLELNANTAAESDVIFNQKTRELVKDIVIHGMGGGDRPLSNHSDNDGEGFKFVLNQAGFDTSQIRYVEQGQFIQCDLIGDTSKRHGLVVEGVDSEHPFGQTLILDHHGDETGNDLSATEVLYESLAASGLLEKTEALDKFVQFITYIDNANHPKLAETFEHSHRTVLGFYRKMSAEELYRFFEQGGDETASLTDDEIRAINPRLLGASEDARRDNLEAKEIIRRGETEGLSLETPYGKAFVDFDGIRRAEAVFALGYKIHIRWQPERKQFFISGWPRDKALAQGIRVRGMWLKPLDDRGPVTIKLGEIIHTLTNGQAAPTGRLLQYLQNELSGRTARFGRERRENTSRERGEGGLRHDRRGERRGPRTNFRTARVAA